MGLLSVPVLSSENSCWLDPFPQTYYCTFVVSSFVLRPSPPHALESPEPFPDSVETKTRFLLPLSKPHLRLSRTHKAQNQIYTHTHTHTHTQSRTATDITTARLSQCRTACCNALFPTNCLSLTPMQIVTACPPRERHQNSAPCMHAASQSVKPANEPVTSPFSPPESAFPTYTHISCGVLSCLSACLSVYQRIVCDYTMTNVRVFFGGGGGLKMLRGERNTLCCDDLCVYFSPPDGYQLCQ